MGPQLGSNLLNLGIEDATRAALQEFGQDLDDVLACEEEPGLGNGGLGRLAACYLDSLATLERPGHRLRHPLRVRHLRPGDPRRLAGREDRQLAGQREPVGDRQARRRTTCVNWGGHSEHYVDDAGRDRVRWVPARVLKGVAYDTPDPGLRGEHVQYADAVERAGRRVVRAGRVQHRRLLQGGRGRGQLGDRHQGALSRTTSPKRASGCVCCSSTSSCPVRCRTCCTSWTTWPTPRFASFPSGSRCSSTTPTRRSASPS